MATTTDTTPEPRDLVSDMMDFEAGLLTSNEEVLGLFSRLVSTGLAWSLQGSYGRAAASLIKDGLLSPEGEILADVEDL